VGRRRGWFSVPPHRPDPKALEAAWAALEDILSPYGGDGMELEDGTVVVDPTSDPRTHPDVRRKAFVTEIEKIATHGCDVAGVVVVLHGAKLDAMTARGKGRWLDAARAWGATRATLVRDIEALVDRLHAFSRDPLSQALRAAIEGRSVPQEPTQTETVAEFVGRLRAPLVPDLSGVQTRADGLLAAVRADPVFRSEVSDPRRRPEGHQPEPWLAVARRKLSRYGVPKESREALLAAVGLKPPAA
jgi:hypothetical protein